MHLPVFSTTISVCTIEYVHNITIIVHSLSAVVIEYILSICILLYVSYLLVLLIMVKI